MNPPLQITVAVVTFRPKRPGEVGRPTLFPYYSRELAEEGREYLLKLSRVKSVDLVDMVESPPRRTPPH